MKNLKGEVGSDFPFSFFEEKAGLIIRNFKVIKPHVLLVSTASGSFILKRYSSVHSVSQQWGLFTGLPKDSPVIPFSPFPSGDFYIRDEYGSTWTLAPYVYRCEALSYKRKWDREAACDVLNQFHQKAKGVKVKSVIVKQPLYIHWRKRFRLFENHYYVFRRHGYGGLFDSLCQVSEKAYNQFVKLDWYSLENRGVNEFSWVHGDVAAHNFLKTEHNKVYLIDFDLASQSPRVYDWIQIAQRFLPFIEDREEIACIERKLSQEEVPFFRLGLAIPASLVREWNTFMASYPSSEEVLYYLQVLNGRWHKQLTFVGQNKFMLT
ncbi:phosphotransferase [Pontibacillus sp. ALD_SL1]|uniref:phosphotransferase n=1 Tax=Pontibacillus sp. ALD_SL1 TaxID=2777185 RepID=UPI001A961A07|nr:phosphotransferase [Pontibacillus sp. ALD_SL1]QSS99090.1 phosphotransferase [Pontibacillus sp. ALD_SL1]